MDPEIIAQLEEQLRELTDTISRQTSMMGEQIAAMNKMAGSASSNAKATTGAAQATTKYQEAQQKAYDQQEKNIQSLKKFEAAMGVLSSAVGAAAGVLGSIANSLLSSQKGLTKYGEVANQAAAGAEKLAGSIPIVGDALGALVGTIGKIGAKLVTDGLALVDSLTTLRDGLVKTGGSLPVTAGQLADLAKDARYSGENMKVLGKITESLGTGLRSLDATAGRGAVKFMEMANVTDETRRQFGRMGVDQERLTELQALYVKQQQASGNSYDLQTKTAAQLRRESLAYAENMQKLSALTGKQAEQLQAEQEAVAAVVQERMATLKEMSDEKRLRDSGRGEEADAIRDERLKRQKFAQELQKMGLTQDEQMKAMQMYRLGAYTDYTKSMAQLNPGLMSLAQGVKNGSINVEKGAEDFGKGLTEGKIRLSNNFNGIADAMDPQVLGDTFGLTSETLKAPLDQLGQSLGESKKAADADTEAAKTRTDATADAVENIKSAERELQAKYQDFLMTQIESISKLINQVDIFTEVQEHAATVAKVMAAGMAAVVAGNVALAAAAWRAANNLDKIAKGMDRMGRGGGPLGDAEDKAGGGGGKPKGRFGKWGGRLLKGLKGGIGGILGGLALDWAADKATETGYTKTGAALGVGSSALSGAGTGALIGSVIPGVGTAIGGAVGGALGGLYGLYNNWGSLTGSDEEKKRREAEVAALQKRVEESKKAIGAPAAAAAIPGAAGLTVAQQQEQQEQLLKDQIERNKKLFSEPMQQSQEEREKQVQTYNDLNSSMGAFKKNVDNTNKSFIDLVTAVDELFEAITGRKRESDTSTSPSGDSSSGAPSGSPATFDLGKGRPPNTATTGADLSQGQAKTTVIGDQTRVGGTIAWRNNNPGNMVWSPGGFAEKHGAIGYTVAGDGNKTAVFATIEEGIAANRALLRSGGYKNLTIAQSAMKWTGGNAAGTTYAKSLADAAGVGVDAKIGDLSDEQLSALIAAKAQREGFKSGDIKGWGQGGAVGALRDFTGALKGASGELGGKFPPAQSAGGIVPLGKALQSMGLRVDENIHFDGKHPEPGAHSKKGGHYDGTAIDVNAPGSVIEANDPKWGPVFDQIARAGAAAGYHTLWKSPDGKHNNHIHFQYSGSMGANSKIGAARGGIFRGPKGGYPMELHGTEMILPLDTPSMQGNKIHDLMSSLTKTGVKEGGIGRISKINEAVMQIVNNETTKAIKAVSEANSPMQNISNEISNSMRKVMEAHNSTMTELTYKLGDMIDALHTSNDVTKKILKKASA